MFSPLKASVETNEGVIKRVAKKSNIEQKVYRYKLVIDKNILFNSKTNRARFNNHTIIIDQIYICR